MVNVRSSSTENAIKPTLYGTDLSCTNKGNVEMGDKLLVT